MRRFIKVAFENFWPTFDPQSNVFLDLLRRRYDVAVSDDPDFLIYSVYGGPPKFQNYRCTRIFYTGENIRPDFDACDFAFSFDYSRHPRNFRLPLYGLYPCLPRLLRKFDPPRDPLAGKTEFCNFVFSNPGCEMRNEFFRLLSQYKRVDAGGALFNNIGSRIGDKLEFIQRYKFTIAFENSSRAGYCTEKLIEPMSVGSLPIYWGDPQVHRDFDTRSFICFRDCGSLKRLVERVIAADRDDALYAGYFRYPWFHENRLPECVDPERILDRFSRIFAGHHVPIAQQGNSLRRTAARACRWIGGKIQREVLSLGQRWRRKRAAKPMRTHAAQTKDTGLPSKRPATRDERTTNEP